MIRLFMDFLKFYQPSLFVTYLWAEISSNIALELSGLLLFVLK